jgi:hypothetical protein
MTVLGQRDSQKSKVYAWEDKHVIGRTEAYIPFEKCQEMVNYIWEQMGWKYPPRVIAQHKNVTKHAASANRLHVSIPEDRGAKTTVIIHELAHSATCDVDGHSERHGPEFVGVYMKMLDKLIPNLNLPVLMYTAQLGRVKFDITHKPNILDD